jgi:hypothetical protein
MDQRDRTVAEAIARLDGGPRIKRSPDGGSRTLELGERIAGSSPLS